MARGLSDCFTYPYFILILIYILTAFVGLIELIRPPTVQAPKRLDISGFPLSNLYIMMA